MQLGTILQKQPGVPCVVRRVKFQLVHLVEGVEHKTDAEALLVPVTEPKFEEALRFATEWLTALDPTSVYRQPVPTEKDPHPEAAPPIPAEVLEREQQRAMLFFALRDVDQPAQPFCQRKDYQLWRKGLVRRQTMALLREYNQFMDEEYPECLTPEQKRLLEEEARGKS